MKKINILALSVIAAQRYIPHSVAAGDKKGRKLLDAKRTERASFLCGRKKVLSFRRRIYFCKSRKKLPLLGELSSECETERVLPMLVTPEYVFKDVTHITPEWLAAKGITALVLDIDNTLTADRSQELPEEVAGWLDIMRRAGIKLTIVSNGAEKRVRPFAQKLGLAYLYRSAKPLPFALIAAQHRMGVKRRQMAMVGDQLYADRMAAALYGIPGLMVVPRGPDLGAQVILKRKWEKKHWQKYYDRGGRTL